MQVIVETYTHVCARRNAYMHEAGLWDGTPPGVPYISPTDGRGSTSSEQRARRSK